MEEIFNKNFSREKPAPKDYNFSEIKEVEPVFIELVKKLKYEIDKRTYGILISDEVGGRIPTLTLREVIKQHCNQETQTIFLPGGKDITFEETFHKIYIGKEPKNDFYPGAPDIDFESQKLAGVYKDKFSMRIFPLKSDNINFENKKEQLKIQENITKAREDVKKLAKETINKVWGYSK